MSGALQTEHDWFRWMLRHNLDYLIVFHNDVQRLLQEKLESEEVRKDPYQSTMIRLYDKINAGNVLLLTLGYVEEMMVLFWKRQFPKRAIPEGTSVSRYKPLLAALGLKLGAMSSWATVQDAYQVRHCLLHANGRVSFMRRQAALLACLQRHEGALEVQNDRVVVTSMFLKRCLVAIRELREAMLGAA